MKRSSIVVLGVLLSVALLAIGCFLKRQLDIDDCLDGGGRWDYETSKCEGGPP